MTPFTPRGETRNKVLRFVQQRILEGRAPTVREVQDAMGFASVQSARAHLEGLVAEGRLEKEPGARGYRLPGPMVPAGATLVPLLGRVQAGALTAAVEDLEGYLPVHLRVTSQELFALRVRGESMKDAGILPGDVVLVRRQSTAEPGDIVVALVDNEATVKTLRKKGRAWVLMPENPAFLPIIPPPGELVILGKVVQVRRDFEPVVLVEP